MKSVRISLEGEQLERIAFVAGTRGASMASVVRDGIDTALPADDELQRAVAWRLAADGRKSGSLV